MAAPIAAAYFTGGAAAGAFGGARAFGGAGRFAGAVQRGRTIYEKAAPFIKGVKKVTARRAVRLPPPQLMPSLPLGGYGFHSQIQNQFGLPAMIPMRAARTMPDPSKYEKVAAYRYWYSGGARIAAARGRRRYPRRRRYRRY